MKIKICPDSTHNLDYHFRSRKRGMKPLFDTLIGRLSGEMDFKLKIGKAYIGLVNKLVFAAVHIRTNKIFF